MANASSEFVTNFWRKQYLDSFIAQGGSKIKFLSGKDRVGKTQCLHTFLSDANALGYKTVYINAKKTWLHDFKEIYAAIFNAVDFETCLTACAQKVITEMGYRSEDILEEMNFADYLQSIGAFDPLTKREIRDNLSKLFFSNTWIDNNFAISSALITSGILGYPALEPTAKDLLLMWHRGEKEARVSALRKLGLSPSKITKFNARHMLRSLIEIIRLAGSTGLVVGIDDLDILTETSSLEEIRYTKMRREDAYESIRELIDGIDTFSHFIIAYSFNERLIEDESKGLKSYQALWMRIQNEIDSDRTNGFSDIIELVQ